MKLIKTAKKLLTMSLAFVMATVSVSAATFSDLKGYLWAEKYINDVTNKGIISGYPDGTYKPGYSVTRIETLVMIANLYPKSEIDTVYKNNSSKYFESLNRYKIDEWARPYVVFALEKGIIPNSEKMLNSLIDTNTKKHLNALRYEVCVFLVRGLNLEGELKQTATVSYNDAKDITAQAIPYIELLQRKGIISKLGDGNGNFFPKKSITRAETAVMLSNSYKYSAKAGAQSTTPPPTISQEIINGKVDLLTFADDNVTVAVTTADGKIRNFVSTKKSLSVTLGGAIISVNDIKVGQQGKFIVTNGQLMKIELEEQVIRYSGKLIDFSETDKTLTIRTQDMGNKVFKYNDNSKIYVNDTLTSIKDLPKDSDIDVYVKAEVVEKASIVFTKNEFNGEVTDYTINSITINTKNGQVKKELAPDIKIYRNNNRLDSINNIAIGDTAKITTDKDKVIEILIDAQNSRYMSAVIKAIEMNSYYNKVVIGDREGNEKILTVANDTVIRINDVKTTIYDLKIGYEVDIYAKGGLVEEILSRGEYKQTTVIGKVTKVDLVDKFIEIKQNNGQFIKVYYNNRTKVERLSNGSNLEPRSIYEGDSVTGIGILSGGDINATRIIVDIQ